MERLGVQSTQLVQDAYVDLLAQTFYRATRQE